MNQQARYTSFAFSPFTAWRMLFYSFFIVLFCLGYWLKDMQLALIVGGMSSLIITSVYAIYSYSEVTLSGRVLHLQNTTKSITLYNFKYITTWWAYDYGFSTIEINHSTKNKTRGHSNKINIYVKFQSENDECLIYEQIHLGDKFPNNHEYSQNELIDKKKLMKVWDVDKCLEKLNIQIE